MAALNAALDDVPDLTLPPWCFLLSADLMLIGADDTWQPRDMLMLRATCKSLRGPQSTNEFLRQMLEQGLGVPIASSARAQNAFDTDILYGLCRRIFMERVLLSSLPLVAKRAIGEPELEASHCCIFGGSFALHRLLMQGAAYPAARDSLAFVDWVPGDLDVFIPYGCPANAPEEDKSRSQAVLSAVVARLKELMPNLYAAARTGVLVKRRTEYDDVEDEVTREPVKVSNHLRQSQPFEEPAQPSAASTYTRGELRDAVTNEIPDHIQEQDGIMLPVEVMERTQIMMRSLMNAGMLDGPNEDLLGLPRSYKVARVVDLRAAWGAAPEEIPDGFRVDSLVPDVPFLKSWACPRHINIVQYHGEPISPLALVGGFDLLPPQVAVGVQPGTARLHFECSAPARKAIAARQLHFTPNTWPTSYQGSDVECILKAAWVQVRRIQKYVDRGFELTLANGERAGPTLFDDFPDPDGAW